MKDFFSALAEIPSALGQLLTVLWEWLSDGFRRATRRRPNTPRPQRTRASSPRKLKSVVKGIQRIPLSLLVGIALTYILAVVWVFTIEPIKAAWEVAWNDPALLGVVSDEALNARFLLYRAWPVPMLIGIWIGLIFYPRKRRRSPAAATEADPEEARKLNLGWLSKVFRILLWPLGFTREGLYGRRASWRWHPTNTIRAGSLIAAGWMAVEYRPWGLVAGVILLACAGYAWLLFRIPPHHGSGVTEDDIAVEDTPHWMGFFAFGLEWLMGGEKAPRIWKISIGLFASYPLIWVLTPILIEYFSINFSMDWQRSWNLPLKIHEIAILVPIFIFAASRVIFKKSPPVKFMIVMIAIAAIAIAVVGVGELSIRLSAKGLMSNGWWWATVVGPLCYWIVFWRSSWLRYSHTITVGNFLVYSVPDLLGLPNTLPLSMEISRIAQTEGKASIFGWQHLDPSFVTGGSRDKLKMRFVKNSFVKELKTRKKSLKASK